MRLPAIVTEVNLILLNAGVWLHVAMEIYKTLH